MTYTRPAPGDPGNSGATSAVTIVDALSDGLEAVERFVTNGSHVAPATMTSPPTITVGASGAATAITSSAVVAPNDTTYSFTYLGASMSNVGTLGSYANCYRQNTSTHTVETGGLSRFLNVEFETDADDFEVILRTEHASRSRFRVWVNGQPAHAHTQVAAASGQYHRIRVNFGSMAARRIRVEAQEVSFCGVAKLATRTIWKTVRDTGPIAVAMTDSYGVNWRSSTDQWVWDNYMVRAGRYMGWNVYPSPASGTGFLADSSGTGVKFRSRLTADVINLAPEIVMVAGSVNDQGLTLASVESEVNSFFSTLRAALPNATVYGLGGISPLDGYTGNMWTVAAYISTACSANSSTYVMTTHWIAGTGYVGATNGSGNSDVYSDGYHLTTDGYTYASERLVAALSSIVGRRSA